MIREELLIQIFCDIDDFCKEFESKWKQILIEHTDHQINRRHPKLSTSEIMTIVTYFHITRFRTFKDYYKYYVKQTLLNYFPNIIGYTRFVELMKSVLFPLFVFSQSCLGKNTGIAFIDSTILTVCHIRRASSHRALRKIARKGKVSTGWFFGMKLHLVINHKGEIVAYMLTPGNVDDRKPVEWLSRDLFGLLFGDRGYISNDLFLKLYERGLQLITKLRLNMKNKLMALMDKILLKKRGLIESVHNKLKACCQIQHHRHRSPWNFMVNLISGLIAYAYDPEKPHLTLTDKEQILLLAT